MKPFKQEAIDQALHFTVGFIVVWFISQLGFDLNWLQGLFIGLSLALTREVTEGGDIFSPGSLRDEFFWTLGGTIGGLL